MKQRVVVVGAGIIGVCAATALWRDGHDVMLVDEADPGGEQASSYGNAGWLSTSSVVPLCLPGTLRKVPGYVLDPAGPFTIRWAHLPRLLPWLMHSITASRLARVNTAAQALGRFLADAPERHARLAADAGVSDLLCREGALYAYPTRKAFEDDALGWRLRRENGIEWTELSGDALRAREPDLAPRYEFAVLVRSGAFCSDPGAYLKALLQHLLRHGVRLVKTRALGFDLDAGRLKGVRTRNGTLACDKAVIAAGAWSKELARSLGDQVVLEGERGYHVAFGSAEAGPRYSVMLCDAKAICTRNTAGFRIAGQSEFSALNDGPNWRRAAILREWAHRAFPRLAKERPRNDVKVWMGRRPSTPDSLPYIGYSPAARDVVYAFGHGHIGLSSGPMTGRLAADLIGEKAPAIDLAPFAPARF